MALGGIIRSWLLQLPVLLAFLVVSASTYHRADKLTEEFSWKSLDFDHPTPEKGKAATDSKAFIPGGSVPIDVDVHTRRATSVKKLQPFYEWRYMDFLWNNELDRANAIKSGAYNFTVPILIDVDTWKDGRVFVTMIRNTGVPASLATVSNVMGDGGPLLKPYPDWSWARPGDCNGITSVFRIAIDECDRLWILDTGQVDFIQVCPARLLVFDLNTDLLLKRITIPQNIARNAITNESLLITPIVDTDGVRCERTHVYITDVVGHALIVYNGVTFRRFESPTMGPQLSAADVEIAGETFNLPDGIFAMALSPRRMIPRTRTLMFRPFASLDMMSIKNDNLQKAVVSDLPIDFHVTSGVLPSPATAMAFSDRGILFFGLTTQMALACWNTERPLNKENIVLASQDSVTHQFASGLKIIPRNVNERRERIWMSTSRYQKSSLDNRNFSEINFRVLTGYVDTLITGTKCESTSFSTWRN